MNPNPSSIPPLRALIFGAGALGTYIGGSLALHGDFVVFVERPETAQEIRQRGLHLEMDQQPFTLQVAAAAGEPKPQARGVYVCSSLKEALELGPFDVAIFALKSFDTRPVLQKIIPYRASLPPLLCLQNGVENEAILAESLGADKVIPGTVTSAISRRAPGDVILERRRGVGVAGGHPLSTRLVAAFNAAGLNACLYPKADDMKWSKLLTNLLANASSAILDMTPAEVFAHPGLCRLEMEQLREALRVMSAQDIRVVDLPGTPVRLLALATCLPLALSRPLLQRAIGKGRGGKMPSFHIDLHSGRGQSEVDYLNGAVVRFGQRLGIPTPVNRLLNETLLALVEGRLPLEAYAHQPEKLLQRLEEYK